MTERSWKLITALALALALVACGGDEDEEGGGEGAEPAAPQLPPLPDAPALSAGGDVTCAVKDSGEAFCWGRNLDGELGDGTGQNRRTPSPVRGLADAHQVAPGHQHTCALRTNGTVWCWGDNEHGQLGDGTTESRAEPVQVTGLTDAIQVATGNEFSCAVRRGGGVSCWGNGTSGRLGNGAATDSSAPVEVSGITDVSRVGLGAQHACALKSDGTLSCWGSDSQGQVGVAGEDMRAHNQPAQVQGLAGVTDFSTGGDNTCAVVGGALHCWGDAYYGKVANGQSGTEATDVQTPFAVPNLTGVAEVGVGVYHACVRLEAGTLKCWGDDGYGNLGGAERGNHAEPSDVAQMSDAQQLAVGAYHVCVLRQTGAISCWGKSGEGQLGAEDPNDAYHAGDRIPSLAALTAPAPAIPVFERAPNAPAQTRPMVALGSGFGCGVRDDGHVLCWGTNSSGQLGNNTTRSAHEHAVEALGITDAVEVRTSDSRACARRANGTVACWGPLGRVNGSPSYVYTSRPIAIDGVTDAQMIAVGSDGLCVLHATGAVSCQRNQAMQPIAGLAGVAEIVAGGSNACARLTEGGSARCWGSGSYGQLGNDAEDSHYQDTVEVAGLREATQIAFGSSHACAITNGQVSCWGNNRYGQVGNGSSGENDEVHRPASVRGPRSVVEIAAGTYNTLARLEDGSILCWGANDYDQCGLARTSEDRVEEITRPMPVAPGTAPELATIGAPVQLAVGQNAACVLYDSGRLACWGSSPVLGEGSFGGLLSSRSNVPRPLTQVALSSGAPIAAPAAPAVAAPVPEATPEVAPAPAPAPEPEPAVAPAPEPTPTPEPAPAADQPAPSADDAQRRHRTQVESAVRSAARACYSSTGSHGALTIHVEVAADGRVITSRVVQDTTGNQEVGRCLSGAMVGRRFTNPRQTPLSIDIPFTG